MEAVSASKMRRAQDRTLASREYASKAREVLAFLASQPGAEGAHPLLQERATVRRVALIVITPDRGLAGGLISNILRRAMRFVQQNQDKEIEIITIGRKGREFMRRYGPPIVADFKQPSDAVGEADATAIAQVAMDAFLSGQYDAVYLAYAQFVNVMTQNASVQQLLPLGAVELSGTSQLTAEYLIEPNPEALLDSLLPALVDMQVYQALLESLASEHSARMVAMRSATENAKQLAEDLQLTYNKARQTAITSEILDIAGGAEALAQSQQ